MIKVLALIDYYIPGFKGGGPQRTLHYLVECLGDEFDFRVLTRDRDLGDTSAYTEVPLDTWVKVGKGSVYYTPAAGLSLGRLRRILNGSDHDVLYLNSLFAPPFTLKPLLLRRLGLLRRATVIVRPRGELNKGAVAIKSGKKLAFLALVKLLGLYKDVIWHASSDHEVDDIHRHFGKRVNVLVAPNLPQPFTDAAAKPPYTKTKGELKLVFLSRISTKKNLLGALRMLDGLQGRVELNVYGPIEDAGYWAQCQAVIQALPEHITVRYEGPVSPEVVTQVFSSHHLLFFPTFGENFGHVIFEALAAGCPILLSDQTPWRGLAEQGCGWDFPLDAPDKFRAAIQQCIDLDQAGFNRLSQGARQCALDYAKHSDGIERNRQLFLTAGRPTN